MLMIIPLQMVSYQRQAGNPIQSNEPIIWVVCTREANGAAGCETTGAGARHVDLSAFHLNRIS